MDITNIVSNVGFPIFTFIVLAWYINKQAEMHSEEVEKLQQAFMENSKILASLKEVIEGWGNTKS